MVATDVLPDARLPAAWRMSDGAVRDAFVLERTQFFDHVVAAPHLAKRLFGVTAPEAVEAARLKRHRELSLLASYVGSRAACTRVRTRCTSPNAHLCAAACECIIHRVKAAAGDRRAKDDESLMARGKPVTCQCWFMELDDSAMSQWFIDRAQHDWTGPAEQQDPLSFINASLPTSRLTREI